MCQTAVISRRIGRIGRHSFDRRMRLASPLFQEKEGDLGRILNDVDKLCERLHVDFPTITAEDYRLFGPELKIVIKTLKDLHSESLSHKELKGSNDLLRQQISDLEEIDHDIREFRVNAAKDKEIKQTLAAIGQLDFSQLF